MSVFQKSIIKKHLSNLDKNLVEESYQKFKLNFSHSKIEKIKKLKEEEYQDGFLRDLFVDVLGYTLKPDDNFNLVREFKNQSDSKKADGAILKDTKAIAVIELKSTTTKDLTSVTEQAFNYKNNQPSCKYVVTSNFQKLRFYIDYANEYEEFNLFNLDREDFELLYLILSKESILSDLPSQLKKETEFHEQNVSNKLYKDYSIFKTKLFENLVKNNSEFDKLTLFKKSQKLLDRFLFILFAEDRGLLPPNSISRIIKRYNILKDEDSYKPIYDIYKQYFGYMNSGRKGKSVADDVPAYNGGLFTTDKILESLIIDDKILISDLLNLSEYDFNTEVDVNILGHIFEHSLNDIEEITAEIAATASPREDVPFSLSTTNKRKKDGVFYTPKYITQYIVENTIGTLCQEKRKELALEEVEFDGTYRTKDNILSTKGKKLFKQLENYKDWLKSLKILDPACGSGAFLNQALNFLISEHKSIDDIISELTNTEIRLFDTEKAILENNLYGVDINEESVEIAKLSLWLRTARKDRKLSDLSNNIKCGNSLIDDPSVAGDKAFNWEREFPQVFTSREISSGKKEIEVEIDYLNLIEKNAKLAMDKAKESAKFSQEAINYSLKVAEYAKKQRLMVNEPRVSYESMKDGFDVVIGNPPYVDIKALPKIIVTELFKKFNTTENRINLYSVFIEQAFRLVKSGGIVSFINPNSILVNSSYRKIRELLFNSITKIIKLPDDVFPDAKVETIIFEFRKGIASKTAQVILYKKHDKIESVDNLLLQSIEKSFWKRTSEQTYNIYASQFDNSLFSKIEKGSKLLNSIANFSLGITPYDKYKGHSKETIKNREFHSLSRIDNTFKPLIKGENIIRYNVNDEIKEFLKYGDFLGAPREEKFFLQPRIIVRQIVSGNPPRIFAGYTEKSLYFTQIGFAIISKSNYSNKYILSILNSKLINYYHKYKFLDLEKNLFQKILIANCKNFPIKETDNQQQFVEKVDIILQLNEEFQITKKKFINLAISNFDSIKITKKIDAFYNYKFKTFFEELKKQKIRLSLLEQDEWNKYFTPIKNGINNIQTGIRTIDNEIDQMVYELYDLTEDEIKIIESTT